MGCGVVHWRAWASFGGSGFVLCCRRQTNGWHDINGNVTTTAGSYGAVAEAIDHVRGTRVAIKQIRDVFGVFENGKRIFREITVLGKLSHENIVKIVHLEMPKSVALPCSVCFLRVSRTRRVLLSDAHVSV